jgi:bacteriorhodopsin
MNKKQFYFTLNISIIVQIITGIIGLLSLFVGVPETLKIISQLLFLETFVQIVEGVFYAWLVYNFNSIQNVTPKRYIDWIITTPTMLITLIVYLIYLKDKTDKHLDLYTVVSDNFDKILKVVLLNWLMLFFGYLGEEKIMPTLLGVTLGFIPFLIYYYIIFENYVSFHNYGWNLFLYFFFFWSLYGVVAVMPYYAKNTFYNILDLFSKNFFGLFLSYIIISNNYQ